jgi:hypothetical protein
MAGAAPVNGVEAFAIGIAPGHVPALIAAALLPVVVLLVRTARVRTGAGAGPGLGLTVHSAGTRPSVTQTWAAWLLGISAAVHLALPLGHLDAPVMTLAYVGSGTAYAWLALRAAQGRSWRLASAPLLGATLIAYLVVTGTGREEPDQVGIATALVELAALGLCLRPTRRGRFAGFAASAATVAATVIVGATIWIGSFLAHAATDNDVAADPARAASAVGHTGDHHHDHGHAARAQAGVVMRPPAGHDPTVDQRIAADRLAAATREAMRRFAKLDAALAAGFELPWRATGTDVHLDNKANKNDGRVLDPQRPETLVYAIDGDRATLLGVVFVIERAGVAGPEPGGPITRWHAHNICLTAFPPGFGIVTPFGTCPALSVNVTIPEMMHVWVVDNPKGAYAEGLDKTWVAAYHALHGLPYSRD